VINLNEVGALPSYDANGIAEIRFGLYLPGIRAKDGFSVVVRIIHAEDRFNPLVKAQDEDLRAEGADLDLWSANVALASGGAGHSGEE